MNWDRRGMDIGGGGPRPSSFSDVVNFENPILFARPFAGEFFKTNLNLPPGCKRWIISFMGRAHRPSAIRHRPVTRVSLTIPRWYHNRTVPRLQRLYPRVCRYILSSSSFFLSFYRRCCCCLYRSCRYNSPTFVDTSGTTNCFPFQGLTYESICCMYGIKCTVGREK